MLSRFPRIAELLDCHPGTVRRWISRFNDEGAAGLADHAGLITGHPFNDKGQCPYPPPGPNPPTRAH
jgi:Homeodomain-like domain